MVLTDPREGERLELLVRPGGGAAGRGVDQPAAGGRQPGGRRTTSWRWSRASARRTGWRTRCWGGGGADAGAGGGAGVGGGGAAAGADDDESPERPRASGCPRSLGCSRSEGRRWRPPRSSVTSANDTGSSIGSRWVNTLLLGTASRTSSSICSSRSCPRWTDQCPGTSTWKSMNRQRARLAGAERVEPHAGRRRGGRGCRRSCAAGPRGSRCPAGPSASGGGCCTPVRTMLSADRDGDDRIEPMPAGERRGADADDDADRGPDVAHQVMGVGLERDGLVAAAGPEQDPGDDEVDDATPTTEMPTPSADLLDRLRREQPALPRCRRCSPRRA